MRRCLPGGTTAHARTGSTAAPTPLLHVRGQLDCRCSSHRDTHAKARGPRPACVPRPRVCRRGGHLVICEAAVVESSLHILRVLANFKATELRTRSGRYSGTARWQQHGGLPISSTSTPPGSGLGCAAVWPRRARTPCSPSLSSMSSIMLSNSTCDTLCPVLPSARRRTRHIHTCSTRTLKRVAKLSTSCQSAGAVKTRARQA